MCIKKQIILLAIAVVAFLVIVNSIDCYFSNSWTIGNIKNSSTYSERYSLKLGHSECVIFIGEKAIAINTWDKDKGISEHIDLKNKSSYYVIEGNIIRGEYGLFAEKYKEKAKKLPEHVRKMFAGHYGIG